jgi:aryl-alcohol dehydrogenase-like predicted oxidoreductase
MVQKSKYDATADADRLIVERLAGIAEERGIPRVQVALAWLLQKEPITAPIVGATKISHLEDAAAALRSNSRRRRWPRWKSHTYLTGLWAPYSFNN